MPINTTVSQDVTITVDAGYRAELASGSGINVPFGFSFSTCGASGGFAGPGTCTITQSYTPTAVAPSSATTTVFECPVVGGSCLPINIAVQGSGISTAAANPASIDFGSVPINTTASRDVTLTIDAGYRAELASGSGINAPFGFSFSTCGASGGFAGPGTCSVTESYTPTSVTQSSGTTTVFECPVVGGTCLPIPFAVQGTGVSVAEASPTSIDFGSVPINTTAHRDVSITVDTGYRAELASGSGINVPFGFSFNTCGGAGGFTGPGTCTVTESYTPTSLASSSATTTVFECPVVGGTCLPIPFSVQGTGVSVAAASPTSIDFGNVPINTTAHRDVTITADAGYEVELASGSGINAPFGLGFGTCSGVPGAGDVHRLRVVHADRGHAFVRDDNGLRVPGRRRQLSTDPVRGAGHGVSVSAASPTSIDFGAVAINTTASRAVSVTVDAGYQLSLASGGGINAPFSFSFAGCSNFPGLGSCSVTESYTPTAVSSSSTTLTVFECPIAGGACVPITVSVQGSGVSNAAASPTSIDFGAVPINTTASRAVNVTVDAGFRLSLASGSGINAPFNLSFDGCSNFPGPGSCSVTESYSPTAVSSSSGTLNLFECPVVGGSCLPINVSLQGSGVSNAAASPSSIDFGAVPINTTASRAVNVTVDAGFRLSLASGSGINAPFSLSFGTCSNFSGPGSCSVTESYAPTALSNSSGTLTLFECPVTSGGCRPINVAVQGSGVSNATASPASIDFGNVPITTTVKRSLTLKPDVGYRISLASGAGINAPFSFSFAGCSNFGGPGSCVASESFKPTTLAAFSGTLTISECPIVPGSCLPINVAVQGVGVKFPSTVTLTSSANPSLLNRAVTFTAKVDDSAPGGPAGP